MAWPVLKKGLGRRLFRFCCLSFIVALVLSAICLLQSMKFYWRGSNANRSSLWNGSRRSEFGILGVPWCRTKRGLHVEWTREDLLQSLSTFVALYQKRPVRSNVHGMQFDHSFGLWFMASWLKPDLIIESGALKGHSTWVLRQARPNVPIVTISPVHPRKYAKKGDGYVDSNCQYFCGSKFVDFGRIDWNRVLKEYKIQDKGKVLAFFDDHQSELRRAKEALAAGFQHLVFEDNYDTGTGDHYSLRQICDQVNVRGVGHNCHTDGDEARIRAMRAATWEKAVEIKELCGPGDAWWGVRGEMRDNFNHASSPISAAQHRHNSQFLESVLDLYWELPPVAGPGLTKQTRYDPARTGLPLIDDQDMPSFRLHGLASLNLSVFNGYTQMAYIRIS